MVFFLFIVLVVAALLERLSLRLPVSRVSYEIRSSRACVEPGEEFSLITTIENAAGRKIPYLYLKETIPHAIELVDENSLETEKQQEGTIHYSKLFVRKNERVKRSVYAKSYQRGMHYLRSAELHFGDFLGFSEQERHVVQSYGVLVYPARLTDERLRKVTSDIIGEVSVRSFLFEDPMLVAGYRDYTGREPFRAVSFPQSARRNKLVVKEFDHTREELLNIVLDVGYKGDFDHYFNQREAVFSVIRTICESLEQKGCHYRLITNMASGDGGHVSVLHGGGGGSSFNKLLEILGMASGAAACKTEELLDEVVAGCGKEGEFLYVAHRKEEGTVRRLEEFRQQYGIRFHCLYGEEYEAAYLACQERLRAGGRAKGGAA